MKISYILAQTEMLIIFKRYEIMSFKKYIFALQLKPHFKMKKITLFLMLLVASASHSQIKRITLPNRTEIGKITPGGILAMECEKMEDTY